MSDNDQQDTQKDPQGHPKGHQNSDGSVTYSREGDERTEGEAEPQAVGDAGQPVTTGYSEPGNHVPDPTSMSGTLETSGTGGGRHAHLSGVSRAFGDVETFIGKVESFAHEKVAELVEGVKGMIREEEANTKVQPVTQQTTEDGGIAQHEGDVVQSDGTGHPAPAAPNTPADQTQAGTADTTTESASAAPVAEPEQPTLDGDKDATQQDENTSDASADKSANARRTPAKKTAASAKSNGTAKK